MSRQYRIKDIAEKAGVSTGTVDRILHKRGKVSDEAREKVEKVLKEIDYHPNLAARALALGKAYHFYVLIPEFNKGEYWAMFDEGIQKAQKEYAAYNVEIHYLFFNQFDRDSFDRLEKQINVEECQGVVIATLFKEGVISLSRRLDRYRIPYIFVDAFVPEANAIAYFGPHSYNSGYIAGRLMYTQIQPSDDVAVFRFIRKGELYSTQVKIREDGFRNYLMDCKYTGKLHYVNIHADNITDTYRILDDFINSQSGIHAGIIFNSRAHLLGRYFSERCGCCPCFKLIGYDVIEENIRFLNSGHITHLIAQRPEVQGINSIKALFRYLVMDEKPQTINYMPIDVLVKENITYYNNYI